MTEKKPGKTRDIIREILRKNNVNMKKTQKLWKKYDFRVFHGKFAAGLRKKQNCATFSTLF